MSYSGTSINIPLGDMGLYTDDAQTIAPPQGLLLAENVQCRAGFIEKEPGSKKWNASALPSGVVAFFDWWPDSVRQRLIVVCKNGKVYRFTDAYNFTEVTPTGTAPVSLRITGPVTMVSGGQELANGAKKLFIFTGNDPVQVIVDDGATRRNMTQPAADWTTNQQPSFGMVFQNRLWCFGNINRPHMIYGSSVSNHEDFVTLGSAVFVNIFPGESERLISAYSYKGRMMLFKYPYGFYYLDLTDPTVPIPQKLGDSFGSATGKSVVQVMDDLWVGNSSGTITSLMATNALGGMQQGDIVKQLKCYRFMLENTAPLRNNGQETLWYEAKKLCFFTYYSPDGVHPNRILTVDFQSGNPRATFTTKDQPNTLGLIRDISLVKRPFYGAEDGFIYEMDRMDRNVGGNAYTAKFQLPYLDFGFAGREFAEVNKNFDFLEVTFEPTGNWDLMADIFIDNRFIETVKFRLAQDYYLDTTARWDKFRWSGPGPRSRRVPIHGMGRRISVRFYHEGLNQGVKVSGCTFYFRPAGQAQKSGV